MPIHSPLAKDSAPTVDAAGVAKAVPAARKRRMEKPAGLMPELWLRFQMMGTAMSTMVTLWVNWVMTVTKTMNPIRNSRTPLPPARRPSRSVSRRPTPASGLLMAAETGMDAASIQMTFQLMPAEQV